MTLPEALDLLAFWRGQDSSSATTKARDDGEVTYPSSAEDLRRLTALVNGGG